MCSSLAYVFQNNFPISFGFAFCSVAYALEKEKTSEHSSKITNEQLPNASKKMYRSLSIKVIELNVIYALKLFDSQYHLTIYLSLKPLYGSSFLSLFFFSSRKCCKPNRPLPGGLKEKRVVKKYKLSVST
jgi:hypothetical protein